jgi:hypothetical protein
MEDGKGDNEQNSLMMHEGSAFECAACLDASVAKKLSTTERIQPGKELLERIVEMLSKLVARFDPDLYRVREGDDTLGDAEPIEDEDDDEYEDDRPGNHPHL